MNTTAPSPRLSSPRLPVWTFVIVALVLWVVATGSFILMNETGHGRYDMEWFYATLAAAAVVQVVVAGVSRSLWAVVGAALGLAAAVAGTWVALVLYIGE